MKAKTQKTTKSTKATNSGITEAAFNKFIQSLTQPKGAKKATKVDLYALRAFATTNGKMLLPLLGKPTKHTVDTVIEKLKTPQKAVSSRPANTKDGKYMPWGGNAAKVVVDPKDKKAAEDMTAPGAKREAKKEEKREKREAAKKNTNTTKNDTKNDTKTKKTMWERMAESSKKCAACKIADAFEALFG